jgi:preprotein translocase subunit SecF
MKKIMINLSIFTVVVATLIGCSNEFPKEIDFKQLTRVDIQIFTDVNSDNNEIMITEEEKIKALREVLAKVDWEQNVKAQMTRKEDVKATLFITFDKNMPERLFEYFIWFNQGNESATIIDREKNALGTLDKEDALKLKDILVNN